MLPEHTGGVPQPEAGHLLPETRTWSCVQLRPGSLKDDPGSAADGLGAGRREGQGQAPPPPTLSRVCGACPQDGAHSSREGCWPQRFRHSRVCLSQEKRRTC